MIKIWVDDIRPAPEGYDIQINTTTGTIVRIIDEFRKTEKEDFKDWQELFISLDHDSGDYRYFGGDYIKVLEYLGDKYNEHPYSKFAKFIRDKVIFHLHTANPVGRDNMRRIIQRNGWREV